VVGDVFCIRSVSCASGAGGIQEEGSFYFILFRRVSLDHFRFAA